MERAYWFNRKRASIKAARNASSSAARLVHYDLAGRYSVLAMSDTSEAIDPAKDVVPRDAQVVLPVRAESADDV